MKKHALLPLFVTVAMLQSVTFCQIRIIATEPVPTAGNGMFGYAQFSRDGNRLYYSTLAYDGIWEFNRQTGTTTEITKDQGSGFGFAVAPDGRSIAYRRTIRGQRWTDKTQEILVKDLRNGTTKTAGSARTLTPPAYLDDAVSFIVGDDLRPAPPKKQGTYLEGIVGQKIVVVVNGVRTALDPLGNGSYIWPSLSPDRTSLVAYDMDNGAFIASVDGTLKQRLGKADAPVWTRDGKWIISFSEQNDGYRITGADLYAVRADGSSRTRLTETPQSTELFPSCSPTEDMIVCHTLDGKLLLMTYTVQP